MSVKNLPFYAMNDEEIITMAQELVVPVEKAPVEEKTLHQIANKVAKNVSRAQEISGISSTEKSKLVKAASKSRIKALSKLIRCVKGFLDHPKAAYINAANLILGVVKEHRTNLSSSSYAVITFHINSLLVDLENVMDSLETLDVVPLFTDLKTAETSFEQIRGETKNKKPKATSDEMKIILDEICNYIPEMLGLISSLERMSPDIYKAIADEIDAITGGYESIVKARRTRKSNSSETNNNSKSSGKKPTGTTSSEKPSAAATTTPSEAPINEKADSEKAAPAAVVSETAASYPNSPKATEPKSDNPEAGAEESDTMENDLTETTK